MFFLGTPSHLLYLVCFALFVAKKGKLFRVLWLRMDTRVKQEGEGVKYFYVPTPWAMCRLSIWSNQPLTAEILTQLSRYKRAKSNLLVDENGPQEGDSR